MAHSRRRPRVAYTNIIAWRDAHGLTQEQAAKAFGISNSHLCNIERGLRAPGRQLALHIAALTNVPLESLLQLQRIA